MVSIAQPIQSSLGVSSTVMVLPCAGWYCSLMGPRPQPGQHGCGRPRSNQSSQSNQPRHFGQSPWMRVSGLTAVAAGTPRPWFGRDSSSMSADAGTPGGCRRPSGGRNAGGWSVKASCWTPHTGQAPRHAALFLGEQNQRSHSLQKFHVPIVNRLSVAVCRHRGLERRRWLPHRSRGFEAVAALGGGVIERGANAANRHQHRQALSSPFRLKLPDATSSLRSA